MSATNQEPAKGVEGVIEATRELGVWARTYGDSTAIAAVSAITHHNWHAADTMPSAGKYTSTSNSQDLWIGVSRDLLLTS